LEKDKELKTSVLGKEKKQITKNTLFKFDPELANKYTLIGESQIRFKINDYRPYHFE